MKTETTDEKLLQKFQRLSNWMQVTCGVTNFRIAKIFLILYAIGYAIFLQRWFAIGFLMNIDIVWYVLVPVAVLRVTYVIESSEKSYFRNSTAFKNPAELLLAYYRKMDTYLLAFIILMFVTGIGKLVEFFKTHGNSKERLALFYNGVFFLLPMIRFCYIFFGSCTPQPPSKSKVRKSIEKIKEVITLAPKAQTA